MGESRPEVPRITYAQNFEDVRLWKAVGHLEDSIWVDVGASHPVALSVTRLFADRGWHGVNLEPGPNFELLESERPSDVNLAVVVTDHEGEVEFNIAWPNSDLSSLHLQNLEADPVNVESWQVIRRPAMTLSSVLERHAADTQLAFLKVDVEGAEREVFLGNDWERFRPIVVVAESVEPGTHRPSYAAWEPILLDAGYEFAVDDGLNRFYARADHPEVRVRLAEPVSVLDGFAPHAVVLRDLEILRLESLLDPMRSQEEALLAAVDHLRVRTIELEDELLSIRRSWSLRIGRLVVRVLRPLRPVLRPMALGVLATRRRWARRRRGLRDIVATLVAPGAPFAPATYVAAGEGAPVAMRLRDDLMARRRTGPHLLDPDEWTELRRAAAIADGPVELERLAALPDVAARPAAKGSHHALVIDAHAIDLPPCGTRSHARSVLGAVLDAVPDDVQVLSLLPFADPGDRALRRFDGVWDHDAEGEVGAFLQLAPFIHDHDDTQIRLVTAPGIRTAGVFLDAIIGTNPHDFLQQPERFYQYQFGLECLARMDRVLSLSAASDDEVVALGIGTDRIVRTGSVPREVVDGPGARVDPDLPFDRWVVVIGNGLVHKNLPVGVVGAAAAAAGHRDLGIVVLAGLDGAQSAALGSAVARLGLDAERFVVRSFVDDATYDALLRGAETVVVPSRHEGYSLTVVEAIERGTPVVVSDIPAHRELLGPGRWMFGVDDPAGVRRALRRVLGRRGDDALADERRALAAHVDPDRFDRTVGATVEWLCRGLAARGPRSRPAFGASGD